jgi:predicted P-loop ATPase
MTDTKANPARYAAGGAQEVSEQLERSEYAPNAPQKQATSSTSQLVEAERFLTLLRPGGAWVLSAIEPIKEDIKTVTVRTADEAAAFVREHDGRRNLYYSVNPTRGAMNKKAAKTDIAAIEYGLADLDPVEGESADDAKARYLAALGGDGTAVVDSGNGIQVLWKLERPIVLGKLIKNKKGVLEFSPEDQALIDDVEGRIKARMEALGAKAGTQNIDRILRLPGTTNLPNKTKLEAGRVACPTKLLWFNGTTYDLDDFPKPAGPAKGDVKQPKAGQVRDEIDDLIQNGCGDRFNGDRSAAVWKVVNEMLRRGYLADAIVPVLLNPDNGISEHIRDQSNPKAYAEKQVAHAAQKIDFLRNEEGRVTGSLKNIRIAMLKLGVIVRHDLFADRTMLDGLPGFGPVLDDAAMTRLWVLFDERFHFQPYREIFYNVVMDMARINSFHPVRDYIEALEWDGKPRLNKWLITYAGARESKYTQAVGALTLIAAVRRIRKPGCKFDEMLVLEQPKQGTEKSTALAVLAVHDDWFSDDMPLTLEGKRVIEMIRGRWIIEAAELSGMKKADVEHVKTVLSRRVDRARMAWGRLTSEAPRQCVMIGTTNKSEYLRDTTGNRRFWPVLVKRFDLAALRRDRDQLWAEAAAREAKGESIRLARHLWPDATKQQEERLADDPFVAVLAAHLDGLEGKIRSVDVYEILNLHGAQLTPEVFIRTAEAMKRLGWKRPNKAGTARFGDKVVKCFIRGNKAKMICVTRTFGNLSVGLEEPEKNT